jgi:bifunctional UDP-N-acetylglucosamine pyrophosphorylase/glucosamine-1-phosphate N-acetyltransferase
VRIGLIIAAAGYGSFRSDESVPKVVEPLNGVPLVVYPLLAAQELGVEQVVVVVNNLYGPHVRRAIRNHGPVCAPHFVVQPDRYGSADAVARACPLLREQGVTAALVVYPDMPLWSAQSMRRLIETHTAGSVVTMTIAERECFPQIDRYGRVLRDAHGRICRIVEPENASPHEQSVSEVNPSLWVWDLDWFERHASEVRPVEMKTPGRQERHMPPLIEMAYRQGARINEVHLPSSRTYEALGANTEAEFRRLRDVVASAA